MSVIYEPLDRTFGRNELGQAQASLIEVEMKTQLASLEAENAKLREALADFLKCARCDPRMDGRQVFSTMNASAFGRAWQKHRSILTASADFSAPAKPDTETDRSSLAVSD